MTMIILADDLAVISTTHAGATLAMAGLIWFVQIVHYPLLTLVGENGFADYEAAHMRRTGWVVGPLMILELVTAVLLAVTVEEGLPRTLAWGGLAILAVIWTSTAGLQAPYHRRLARRGFDMGLVRRLVTTNWIRTVAWSARGVISLLLILS